MVDPSDPLLRVIRTLIPTHAALLPPTGTLSEHGPEALYRAAGVMDDSIAQLDQAGGYGNVQTVRVLVGVTLSGSL